MILLFITLLFFILIIFNFTVLKNTIMENETKPVSGRLYYLDALRGFDMFWIMGGQSIFIALASLTGWPVFKWCAEQLDHVPADNRRDEASHFAHGPSLSRT